MADKNKGTLAAGNSRDVLTPPLSLLDAGTVEFRSWDG